VFVVVEKVVIVVDDEEEKLFVCFWIYVFLDFFVIGGGWK
jgi:hypothetical protein